MTESSTGYAVNSVPSHRLVGRPRDGPAASAYMPARAVACRHCVLALRRTQKRGGSGVRGHTATRDCAGHRADLTRAPGGRPSWPNRDDAASHPSSGRQGGTKARRFHRGREQRTSLRTEHLAGGLRLLRQRGRGHRRALPAMLAHRPTREPGRSGSAARTSQTGLSGNPAPGALTDSHAEITRDGQEEHDAPTRPVPGW